MGGAPRLATYIANTSGATDTATLSLNPALTTTNSRSPKSTDLSTSFSLAAMKAAVEQKNPLGRPFYDSSVGLRRFSISLTDSFPGGSKATADQGSNSYGIKFVINPRDPARHTAALCNFFAEAQLQHSAAMESLVAQLSSYLYTALGANLHTMLGLDAQVVTSEQEFRTSVSTDTKTLGKVISNAPSELQLEINLLIERAMPQILQSALQEPELAGSAQYLKSIVNAPQFAVEYSARISKGSSANLYRTQLDYDQAFWKQLTGTTNVGYDFQNAQTAGSLNRNIGRIVEQFSYPILPYKNWSLKLAVSGEGDWGSHGVPMYKSQGKLTVAVFPGCEIPLAVTLVNRTATVNRADIKGQAGLTVDFTKLWIHSKPIY